MNDPQRAELGVCELGEVRLGFTSTDTDIVLADYQWDGGGEPVEAPGLLPESGIFDIVATRGEEFYYRFRLLDGLHQPVDLTGQWLRLNVRTGVPFWSPYIVRLYDENVPAPPPPSGPPLVTSGVYLVSDRAAGVIEARVPAMTTAAWPVGDWWFLMSVARNTAVAQGRFYIKEPDATQ